jgi:apolipoprotein N-acyltransferase
MWQGIQPTPGLAVGGGGTEIVKAKDSLRKWIWWFLGGIAALQLYFVRELLAAFALFALGFIAIGLCVATFYFLLKGWAAGVGWLADSQNAWILATRRAVATVEDWGRRPIRRPDSEPAH